MFRSVLASRASEGQGGGSAQGPPLVRRSELPGRDPQEAALAVYRQRFQELGDDLGRGSLTQAQFEE
ncbi:MAG: hypothetical protein M3436_19805, partial [Pseudomonadota bacterium]|nr:hypothetical protein [Pseudomonadota bacterium]